MTATPKQRIEFRLNELKYQSNKNMRSEDVINHRFIKVYEELFNQCFVLHNINESQLIEYIETAVEYRNEGMKR